MSAGQFGEKVKIETTNVNDITKRNDDQVPASLPVAQRKRCEIFKLDVDCCEEIFEWLSIKDLYSFGQTCKRMNRIAGMYFYQNYPGLKVKSGFGKIYCDSTRLDGFSEFIENITLICDASHAQQLKYIESNCKSLKAIEFIVYDSFISNRLSLIRKVLAKIESIIIVENCPNENILDFCPNLKKFKCCWKNADSLLKLNKCPKLEHINLEEMYGTTLNVQAIFHQIPNVRNVQMRWHSFLNNKIGWLGVNLTVENLTIDLEGIAKEDESFFDLLTELYGLGLYKRLHLTCVGLNVNAINQHLIDKIVSVRAVETLEICEVEGDVVWPVMESITKIYLHNHDQFDLTTFPAKVPNLQRLNIFNQYSFAHSVDVIFRFVRSSKQLSKILWHDTSSEFFLDLSALNKERKKLAGACKLIIYVRNQTFLATKFAYGMSRSLVENKRLESLQINDFGNWYLD